MDFLREYHCALGPLVSQFEGTLDQFLGRRDHGVLQCARRYATPKGATYGKQIRALLAKNDPAVLVLDREFETQSVDPMFLIRNVVSPGTTRTAKSWS